jgi:hypothetical protein
MIVDPNVATADAEMLHLQQTLKQLKENTLTAQPQLTQVTAEREARTKRDREVEDQRIERARLAKLARLRLEKEIEAEQHTLMTVQKQTLLMAAAQPAVATVVTSSHLASGPSTALVEVATTSTALVASEAVVPSAEEALPEGEFSPPKPPSAGSAGSGSGCNGFAEGDSDESPKLEKPRRSEETLYFSGRKEGNMTTYLDSEGDYAIVPTKHAVLEALREPGEQPWMKKLNLFQCPPARVVRDADTGKNLYPSADFFRVMLVETISQKREYLVRQLTDPKPSGIGMDPAWIGHKKVDVLARRVALNAISDAFTRMERDDFPTSGFARLVTPYPLPPLPNGFPDLEGRDLQLAGSYREGGIRRASRRLIRESGEVSPYQPTPILAMALAVSGVTVATVSPHAPKSARQLFGSPGDWFGEQSAMIVQLAIGALRVVGAATAMPTPPNPLCVQAPTPCPPTSTTSSSKLGKQERQETQFEDALTFFLANWRDEWLQRVLGGSESAVRTSEHAAAISIRQQAVEHGGKGGVHLRECVNLIFGQNGYLAYRRELRLPVAYDFDIQPAEFIAFRLWRRARSKAASGHCVILAVTRTMYVAVRYFGCPVDMQCALLLKPPKVVVVPATPADCPPDGLVVEIERMAFAAVAAERLHVCADYLIAFQLMMFSRSRKEDFSTARGIRLESMCSLMCVVGSMNMKDGSVQAWWAVPATGMLGVDPPAGLDREGEPARIRVSAVQCAQRPCRRCHACQSCDRQLRGPACSCG